jgi:SsrA-binding protein
VVLRKEYITEGKIAVNRRAYFDYEIEDKFEAGLELMGSEVKSLRLGQANITNGYCGTNKNGEMYIYNVHIGEYKGAGYTPHEELRPRKLLLHKKEIGKLMGAVNKKGYTIVPLTLFFNKRGMAKLEIGIGKGKKEFDKRETIKQRDWSRDKSRILKGVK